MRATATIAATLFFFAALGACSRTDDVAMDTTGVDTSFAATDTGVLATAGTTTATGPGEPDLVHIPLREWSISVSKSPIRAGQTTFHAMNEGTYTHAAEIEGNGQEWKTDPIAPGGTATITANLTPGTYEVYCPIEDTNGNHQQRGMRTTLVVQ